MSVLMSDDERTQLFDVVLSVSADEHDALRFRVMIVDRYHDGPDVPSVIGESDDFDELDDAIEWARSAVQAFMQGDAAR